MKVKNLHNWDISYADARRLQTALAPKVRQTALKKPIKTVAGLDCAFGGKNEYVLAAVVVLSFPDLKIIQQKTAARKAPIPYIPGLLSFREIPACVAALEKLEITPDLFLIDGQGIAHPRRLGLASHLGLMLDKPTVGCAKSRLIGTYKDPPAEKGNFTDLKDPDTDQTIGAVLRTRTNVKPLFVSVGHKCTLSDAVTLTLRCCPKYRQPEPTRQADKLVAEAKRLQNE